MVGYKGILWTLGLVFFVNFASAYLNAGGDMWNMNWQNVTNAAIGAVLAFGINWAMPFIKRYGVGAVKSFEQLAGK